MIAVGVFVANVPLSSDTLRRRIIESLSEKLDSEVELGDLQLRVYPTLRAEGSNLRIRRRGANPDLPPLIAIKSFHVEASIFGLYHKHVDHLRIDGLDINIPPSQVRDRIKVSNQQRDEARAAPTSGIEPEPRKRRGVRIKAYDAEAGQREFERLGREIERAHPQIPIAEVFSLEDAAKAHERLERGHVLGRIVLRIA